eukprot:326213-Hanusia_phi.AAC.1
MEEKNLRRTGSDEDVARLEVPELGNELGKVGTNGRRDTRRGGRGRRRTEEEGSYSGRRRWSEE